MKTNDSFIFSLKNGNIKNSILSRVKNTQYAILNVTKNQKLSKYMWSMFWKWVLVRFSIDNYEVFKVEMNFENNFDKWASGNETIDKFIQDAQLNADYYKVIERIPYDRFQDIKKTAKERFEVGIKKRLMVGILMKISQIGKVI
ncbi:hypothetical protein Glove_71g102 [Diversispora epigaea]|uniref:Uncharacterized protein n=1 Tax=Diversispora epigaea TaxID=1348612 RepID=A0A397JJI8_9GLOM|nr:hypothetical protein Glove_71g102 [Diversispora epigaea]